MFKSLFVKDREVDKCVEWRPGSFCAILLFFILLGSWALVGYADPGYPERIISLGPALTRQVYLLGVEDRLVGVTTYCRRPVAAQKKERVGTVINADLEKIVQLEPDLVLLTPLTSPHTKQRLQGLGIKIVDFSAAKSFSQICGQFLKLGRIVGRRKQAQAIVHSARRQVKVIKKSNKDLPQEKVFMQVGTRPLFTVTKDSYLNDLIEFAGGRNIASDTKIGLYSREKVLLDNPDVIVITTMGIAGEEEKALWENFPTLNAVKNKRIYIVDDYTFCSPTPVSFVQALEQMVELLHPQ